jgi:serine/threonine protein kinase
MMTSAYLDGFAREASIQREFSHPNVVQFLGVYFDPPRLGIVMEYCPHGSLFHVLQVCGFATHSLLMAFKFRWSRF